jgi:hypothetical protein
MKTFSRINTLSLALLLCLWPSGPAMALKVHPVPLEKLIEGSALVFIGTVTSVDKRAGMKRGTYGTGTAHLTLSSGILLRTRTGVPARTT